MNNLPVAPKEVEDVDYVWTLYIYVQLEKLFGALVEPSNIQGTIKLS